MVFGLVSAALQPLRARGAAVAAFMLRSGGVNTPKKKKVIAVKKASRVGGALAAKKKTPVKDMDEEARKAFEIIYRRFRPKYDRPRPELTEQEVDYRAFLFKERQRRLLKFHNECAKKVEALRIAGEKAMAELKAVSPALYAHAEVRDTTPWPMTRRFPTETPAIANYMATH
eukprot:Opistho-1_new@102301